MLGENGIVLKKRDEHEPTFLGFPLLRDYVDPVISHEGLTSLPLLLYSYGNYVASLCDDGAFRVSIAHSEHNRYPLVENIAFGDLLPLNDLALNPRVACLGSKAKVLFCGGFSDSTLRVFRSESQTFSGSLTNIRGAPTSVVYRRHRDRVTVLCNADESLLISGSADCTLIAWRCSLESSTRITPRFTMRGHNGTVIAIAASTELSIAVSSSSAGGCIVHSLYDGTFMREFHHPQQRDAVFTLVEIAPQTGFVVYCPQRSELLTFSLNGRHISTATENGVRAIVISEHGHHLVTAGNGIRVRMVLTLRVLFDYRVAYPSVHSIALRQDQNALLAGVHRKVIVYPFTPHLFKSYLS
jgi:WD40 repeat protein